MQVCSVVVCTGIEERVSTQKPLQKSTNQAGRVTINLDLKRIEPASVTIIHIYTIQALNA